MTTLHNGLDQLDLNIMSCLQRDGRASFTDLAQELGVSIGTVRNRVQRLLGEKYFHVMGRINPQRVGFNAPATLQVSVRPANLVEEIAKTLSSFPEVTYVAIIAGDINLELDIMCRDMPHLTEFITEKLHKLEGVVTVETFMVLKIVKYTQVDFDLLLQDSKEKEEVGV